LLHKPISVLSITQGEYEATIDFSEDSSNDWQDLIAKQEEFEAKPKKKRKNKKR